MYLVAVVIRLESITRIVELLCLRGLTSTKSSFTTNDAMNHILDTQQCDHIHGKTMDSILMDNGIQ